MVCQNCGKETDGIKINGKLFCTNCGEALPVSEEVIAAPVTPSTEPPKAKVIPAEETPELKEEETELHILEAEKEAIDLIIKETQKEMKNPKNNSKRKLSKNRKIKQKKEKEKPSKPIIKHERPMVGHKQEFQLIKGEPDPISEPELPVPHDDMIEKSDEPIASTESEVGINFAETKSEQRMALLTKEEKQNIEEKQQQKSSALRGFFQKGIVESSKQKNKKPKKPIKPWMWILTSIFLLLLAGTGLVVYVNTIGTNAERAKKIAETTVNFSYSKPNYLPVGYELNYQTTATENSITYSYAYTPDKNKTIEIFIEKSNITEAEIFDRYIKENGKEYSQKDLSNKKVWIIGDTTIMFIKDGVLYQIVSSDTISTEEMIKIAEGLI